MAERIGVLGGTFDPPHSEHLLAAVEVRSRLRLDRVLMMVANQPWQKVGSRTITPAPIRLEMVKRAVEGLRGVEACDQEVMRGGDSFTVDTIDELHQANPEAEYFVIVGADVEEMIPTWKDIDRLREMAHLVVVSRSGQGEAAGPEDGQLWRSIERVPIHRLDISGTQLRARVAAGLPVDVLCPPGVVQVIADRGLYSV